MRSEFKVTEAQMRTLEERVVGLNNRVLELERKQKHPGCRESYSGQHGVTTLKCKCFHDKKDHYKNWHEYTGCDQRSECGCNAYEELI